MSATIHGGERNESSPSTTPTTTTTTGPQQQHCFNDSQVEDKVAVVSKRVENTQTEDRHRSNESKTRTGLNFSVSTMKIRSILALVIISVAVAVFILAPRWMPLVSSLFISNQTIPVHSPIHDVRMTSPFMIIIDGGSTGSRLHVFEFVDMTLDDDNDRTTTSESSTATATIVERRGSFRTMSPLSTFIVTTTNYYDQETTTADGQPMKDSYVNKTALKINHVLPLLQYIEQTIPASFTHMTPIYYAATAGMRLLSTVQQSLIYDTFIQIVMEYCHEQQQKGGSGSSSDTNHIGCFHIPRHHIQTLSGELEGYYGVLAANYLHGKIDTNLHMTNTFSSQNEDAADIDSSSATASSDSTNNAASGRGDNSKSITGALDMGGSSTQIVFYTARGADVEEDNEVCMNNDQDRSGTNVKVPYKKTNRLNERHFFTMSYLSYGVDQFRDRLWNLLIYEYEESKKERQEEEILSRNNYLVVNPCSNPGHNVTTIINATTYLLVGMGNVLVCKEYMKRIIPHPIHTPIHHIFDDSLHTTTTTTRDGSKVIGGIAHPSIYNESPHHQEQQAVFDDDHSSQSESGMPSADFLAMSLYFFTFDSIRVFTKDSIVNERWPNPTLMELQNATSTYCTMNLIHDIYPLYDNDPQNIPHPYTRKGIVQHRCMEAIYMISLLETFGFTNHERHITFAFDVNGSEVEWTLGMALQYHSNNNNSTEQQRTCSWDRRVPDAIATDFAANSIIIVWRQLQNFIVERIRNYLPQT